MEEKLFKTFLIKKKEGRALITHLVILTRKESYLSNIKDIVETHILDCMRKHRTMDFVEERFMESKGAVNFNDKNYCVDLIVFEFETKRANRRLKGLLEEINGKKMLKKIYRSINAVKEQRYILPLGELENLTVEDVFPQNQ